jgi:hypothetical protein
MTIKFTKVKNYTDLSIIQYLLTQYKSKGLIRTE